jgi:phosphoserine phosphatase
MGVAFFDMDKTLLDASSGILFVKYLWKNRAVSWRDDPVFITSAEYTLNRMDFPKAMARMSSSDRGGNRPA